MNGTARDWSWTELGVAGAAMIAVLSSAQPATAAPSPSDDGELHNITYVARVDGVAPGGQATFLINDTETSVASLSSIPGQEFEANAVLSDPDKAGMQVSIPWPYSANVHCEIRVDDRVSVQIDRLVTTKLGDRGPDRGVLACGEPLPGGSAASTTPNATPAPAPAH